MELSMQTECVNAGKFKPGFEINYCENMRRIVNDTSMEYEYYKCEVCGKTDSLCYDEMRQAIRVTCMDKDPLRENAVMKLNKVTFYLWKDAQELPQEFFYIQTGMIESFGVVK